jgi:hypothetical protein
MSDVIRNCYCLLRSASSNSVMQRSGALQFTLVITRHCVSGSENSVGDARSLSKNHIVELLTDLISTVYGNCAAG